MPRALTAKSSTFELKCRARMMLVVHRHNLISLKWAEGGPYVSSQQLWRDFDILVCPSWLYHDMDLTIKMSFPFWSTYMPITSNKVHHCQVPVISAASVFGGMRYEILISSRHGCSQATILAHFPVSQWL